MTAQPEALRLAEALTPPTYPAWVMHIPPPWHPRSDDVRAAAAELRRLHAEVEKLRKSLALVQQHHAVAWNRGHTMGVAASQQIVRQAKEAVARDAWGNTQLTEALLAAEAERDALRADAVVVIDGHQIRLADVLRRVLRNLTRKRGRPLWAAVHELTSHGSTVSMGLCRWAGLDPDTGKEIPNA